MEKKEKKYRKELKISEKIFNEVMTLDGDQFERLEVSITPIIGGVKVSTFRNTRKRRASFCRN